MFANGFVYGYVCVSCGETKSLLIESFLFQSSLVSVCFAKFHPNLIIGGTYSGQIVLWDNRSNKRTPVQRTPLSAVAHTVRTTSYEVD